MRPRVIFMGNPGYGGLVLDALLRSDVDLVAVFHQSRSRAHHMRRKLRRYSRNWRRLIEAATRLGQKWDDFRDEKLPALTFGADVHELAKQRSIPLIDGARVHDPSCPDLIKSMQVDVLLVATFGEILPESVLESPKLAAINMHPSLLPRLRGGFPEFGAIIAGNRTAGITYHLMEKKFDAGNLLLQRTTALAEDETTLSLKGKLARLASDAIPDLVGLIATGQLAGEPQDKAQASYCRLTTAFDQIRPTQSKREIRNLINACYDVEDIGRPHFFHEGRKIFALSCGPSGFPYHARDGVLHFDAVRYRHHIHRGNAALDLITALQR